MQSLGPKHKFSVLKNMSALLIFIAGSLYITYPLIFHLKNYIIGKGDELLLTWILNWNIHSFSTNILSIFNANIFYPHSNTLAFSDALFLSSFLSIIPVKFFGEPLVAFNFTLISSLMLLGFCIYLLTNHLTKNFFSSVISGLLVIFSLPVLNETPHLQVIAIYFVPLSILFFLKFIEERKTKFFLITAVLFVLQTYNSFLPGYFIVFSLTIIYIFYFLRNKKEARNLINKRNLLILILSFAMIAPVVLPYLKVSNQFHYVRDIRDTIHFALQPEDLLYPHPLTRLNPIILKVFPQYDPNGELKTGFLGLAFTILAITSLLYFVNRFKKLKYQDRSLFFIAVISLTLSLGPFLHIGRHTIHHPFPIPLPYLLFYYLIPGFNGMRNSARWEILFILIVAVLIGVFLNAVPKNRKKTIVVYIFLISVIVGEFNFPMKFVSIPGVKNFPPEYYFLKENAPRSSIVEMPIYNWDMPPYGNQEMLREYYSTLNFNPMVNGFSGFSPLEWESMVRDMIVNFPNPKTLKKLKEMRVDYVIIHKDEYARMTKDHYKLRGKTLKSAETVLDQVKNYSNLQLVKVYNDTYIYKLN